MENADYRQQLIAQLPRNELYISPIKGLSLICIDKNCECISYMQEPSICLILQGEREVFLGEQCYQFTPEHLMFCPVNMPLTMRAYEADAQKPFVGVSMKLDLLTISEILTQLPAEKPQLNDIPPLKYDLPNPVAESFERLLQLLLNPQDIAFLAPLIQREIYYHLLTKGQGGLVRQNSQVQQIARATQYLQQHFNEPFALQPLLDLSAMSSAGFYQYFKQITSLTPLQYQKSLRLNEARRLLKSAEKSVAEIAYEVGYESPSQFSREYKRQFGVSPSQELG